MLQLRVLGTAGLIDSQGRELREVLVKPKSFALLVYLAIAAPGGFIRRDTLLALFWPESDTAHARNALRQTVHQLRQAVGDNVLVGRGAEELGVDPEQLRCDAVAFHAALQRGAVAEALGLYGGDLLPGFFVGGAPDFDEWLDNRRAGLREAAKQHGWQFVDAKLETPARPHGRAQTKPWRAVAAIALIVVVFASTAWLRRRHQAIASVVSSQSVAVLPFMIRGHDSLAYLRTGMVDLLSTRLDGAARLRSVDPHAVAAVTQESDPSVSADPEEAARVAARLDADLYVLGDAVETAGRLQLDAILVDRSGATLARAAVEGPTASIFELADGLATQLLAAHAGSGSGERGSLTAAAGGSTRSLPAFKSYLAGEAAFERGRYEEAVDQFLQAVTQDTGFALAYYRLAVAEDWTGRTAMSKRAATQAAAHLNRLAQPEAQLLQGFRDYSAAYADAAEGIYLDLTGMHPSNLEAVYMLGEVRFHYNAARGRLTPESRENFERVLAVAPTDGPALIHLARVAAMQDRRAELDSLVSRFLDLYPEGDRALEMRALRAFAAGDRVAEDRIVSTLRGQSNAVLDLVARGVGTFDEDLAGADRLASLFMMPGRSWWLTPRGYDLLSQLSAGRGRWTEVRRSVDALSHVTPGWGLESRAAAAVLPFAPWSKAELRAVEAEVADWRAAALYELPDRLPFGRHMRAYFLGLLATRLDDTASLHGAVHELDRLAATAADSGVALDLVHIVRADRALYEGRAQDALREIEQFRFVTETPTGRVLYFVGPAARFLRAEILEAVGRDRDALQWYGSFPDPNGVDLAFLAQAHLHQAQISERLGRPADARAHYHKFIAMWRDCDAVAQPTLAAAQKAADSLRMIIDQ